MATTRYPYITALSTILFSIYSTLSFADEPLTLASWNLQWFDTTPTEPQQKRSLKDTKALAAYARTLNADIIALQEVADLNSIYALWPKQQFVAYLSPRNHPQRVAFVVKRHLTATLQPALKSLDTSTKDQLRYGLDLSVQHQGQTLRLLNVHLKSGCFNSQRRSKACGTLNQQMAALNQWAHTQHRHFLIMGDFNRQLKRRHDPMWQSLNQSLNLTALGHNRASQCKIKHYKYPRLHSYRYFIDHIVASASLKTHYIANSFTHHPFNPNQVLSHKLSDHCAISIKIDLNQ